jgi:hypothetical protein
VLRQRQIRLRRNCCVRTVTIRSCIDRRLSAASNHQSDGIISSAEPADRSSTVIALEDFAERESKALINKDRAYVCDGCACLESLPELERRDALLEFRERSALVQLPIRVEPDPDDAREAVILHPVHVGRFVTHVLRANGIALVPRSSC